jgi:DNA-binding transcriptional ArsR family regulator
MTLKRLLWWLIAGTRGGINRARVIVELRERPYNANQLAEVLGLDYKTVRHHLELLKEHGVIVPQGEGYGTVFFLSAEMEADYHEFEQIWVKIGKKGIITSNKERDDTHEKE